MKSSKGQLSGSISRAHKSDASGSCTVTFPARSLAALTEVPVICLLVLRFIHTIMHQTFPARQILFSTFTMSEPDRSGQCRNAYATLCMNTDIVGVLNNIFRAGNATCRKHLMHDDMNEPLCHDRFWTLSVINVELYNLKKEKYHQITFQIIQVDINAESKNFAVHVSKYYF
jgi:hypothetical protein